MKTPQTKKPNPRFFRIASAILVLIGSVLLASVSVAEVARFNFESLNETSGGALSSVTLTSGSVTMTLTRNSGAHFDIFNLQPYSGPVSWGARSLDPFQEGNYDPGREFVADFSPAVCVVSVQFGDYDGDDDTFVMEAWSGPGGTGTMLDSTMIFWSASKTFPTNVGRGTVSGGTGSIQSVTFTSVGDYNNSLYYDNIAAKTRTTDNAIQDDDIQLRGPVSFKSVPALPSGGVLLKK